MLLTFSCTGNNKNQSQGSLIQEPEMTVLPEDTIAVMNLVNQYLDCLRHNQVDSALNMLYYLDSEEQIVSLPSDMVSGQRLVLQQFSGKDYEIEYLKFYRDIDNEVKYSCILFEKEAGDNRPNKISFLIKPVRRDRVWYLTMADDYSSKLKEFHYTDSV